MAVVENKRMPQWLSLNVVRFILLNKCKQFLVKRIGLQKIFFNFFSAAPISEGLGTQFRVLHCVKVLCHGMHNLMNMLFDANSKLYKDLFSDNCTVIYQ